MGEVTFQHPPLVEVAFGAHFARPPELHSAHYGLFWSKIQSEFPVTSDQTPIIDPTQATQFRSIDGLLPRVWFLHKEKALLLQIQTDRFYLNWRRLQPNSEYPRFASLLPEFSRLLSLWNAFLDEQGLGELQLAVCELTYINHIAPPGPPTDLWSANKYLRHLGDAPLTDSPLLVFNWGGIIEKGFNKVSMSVQTAENTINRAEKLLQLEIKAESKVSISSIASMVEWMNKANVAIVEVFTAITTEEAQKEIWGRVSR